MVCNILNNFFGRKICFDIDNNFFSIHTCTRVFFPGFSTEAFVYDKTYSQESLIRKGIIFADNITLQYTWHLFLSCKDKDFKRYNRPRSRILQYTLCKIKCNQLINLISLNKVLQPNRSKNLLMKVYVISLYIQICIFSVFLVLLNHPLFYINLKTFISKKWVCFDEKRIVNESIVYSKSSLNKREDDFMAI